LVERSQSEKRKQLATQEIFKKFDAAIKTVLDYKASLIAAWQDGVAKVALGSLKIYSR
jgi:hypothetical protein